MNIGKILDGVCETQSKALWAEVAFKQAQEVAAQKQEEMKQALEVVQKKQEELKKCRAIAAASKQFGGVQWLAVRDDQEMRSAEAREKIEKALRP